MELHIEGATKLQAGKEALFGELTDPRRLVELIPGKEEAKVVGDSKAEARVAVALPGASGSVEVELSVEEAEPPNGARVVTQGRGLDSSLKVTAGFELLGDSPTWIHWTVDAEVEGKIEALEEARLRDMARSKAEELLARVARAAEEPAG